MTADFDLLIIGAEAELGLSALTRDSRVDRLAAEAACSVLRVKAPRHSVQPYVDRRGLEGARVQDDDLMVALGLEVASQGDLFAQIAQAMVEEGEDPAAIEAALWERERRQSTSLASGLQVTSATTQAVRRPRVGLFTLTRPVRFARPDRHRVDVCLVSLAPPGERNRQLWLIQELHPRLAQDDVRAAVRAATDPDVVRGLMLDG